MTASKEKIYDEEHCPHIIFNNLPDPAFICSLDGKIRAANKAACEKFGFTGDELMKMKIDNLGIRKRPELAPPKMRKPSVLKKGAYESEYRSKSKKIFPVEISYAAIDFEGRPAVLSVCRDISERKAAEDMIKKQRDLAEKYFDIAGNIMLIVDKSQAVVLINKKGRILLGYGENRIIGKNWFDNFLPERIREGQKKSFAALVESGGKNKKIAEYFTVTSENTVITSMGERIIKWEKSLLSDSAGNFQGMLCSGTDVTSEKESEKAVRESEARLKAILDHLQSGVLIIDAEKHEIVDANPMAAEMIGCSRDKIIGMTCYSFICSAKPGSCPVTDLGQKFYNTESVLLTADKKELPILKSVVEIETNGKRYLIDSFIDNSGQKRNREIINKKIEELELFNKLAVDRELKMVELKNRISKLENAIRGEEGVLKEK